MYSFPIYNNNNNILTDMSDHNLTMFFYVIIIPNLLISSKTNVSDYRTFISESKDDNEYINILQHKKKV